MGGREFDPKRIRPDEIQRVIEGLRTLSGLPWFDTESTGRVLGNLHIAFEKAQERGLPSSGGSLRERWRRWREQKKEGRQNEELAHLLTTKPSIVSSTGWQIYHPLREEQVSYVRKPNGHFQAVKRILGEEIVTVRQGNREREEMSECISSEYIKIGKMNTCITAESKNNPSGSNAVILTIYGDERENPNQPGYYNSNRLEWYLLRTDGEQSDIETGIVVFENSSMNELHYFQLQLSHSSPAVGVVEMERVAA